ncbi:hypothetical protein [Nocardia pseudovaccinii]|uniref:hypothetical protein n=1 Tax=Nocardia pseudovaccinii TaxID=189540 RepID=UPI000A52799B|nr:hypothetical protein [Nocardia pseudovaccinii]
MTSRIRLLLSVFALVSLGVAGCSSAAPRQVQQSPEPGGTRPVTVRTGQIPGGTITLRTNQQVTFEPNSLRYCTTDGAGFKLRTGETVWLSGISSLEFGTQEGVELAVTYRPLPAKGGGTQIFPGAANAQPGSGRMSSVCEFFVANLNRRYMPGDLISITFNSETELHN